MPNPIQEPLASTKAPDQDLQDMDVLCIFNINVDQWPYPDQDQDSKLQLADLKDKDGLCIFHINEDRPNSELKFIKG